jgi:acetaldehyde dehydrogenase/alcohol dehydrogenase
VVVTDSWTEERGVLADVRRHLTAPNVRVFAEVVPEPGEDVVVRGVQLLRRSEPDLIVAVGGGSVIDAAKAMRLFYEHPDLTMDELSLPFLDPRKRVVQFPQDPHRARLVGVPTTAGTGSEATPAAVLTVEGHKSTLVDYTLTPDVAIIDPRLMTSMPPAMTADTGIDALTHALEALVSVFASPFSDAFAVQSARLIFQWLPKAYADGSDVAARTGMADAANIAGQAFANAFVGVNHALAHSVGARFHLAHGRANAIFLPHVLRYNAALPMKFMPGPGTSSYVAPDKYAQLGRVLFGGHGPLDSRTRLFRAVDNLLDELQLPRTLKEAGIGEEEYLAALPDLALTAFADSSMRTNPRMPLIEELTDLLRAGYYG